MSFSLLPPLFTYPSSSTSFHIESSKKKGLFAETNSDALVVIFRVDADVDRAEKGWDVLRNEDARLPARRNVLVPVLSISHKRKNVDEVRSPF